MTPFEIWPYETGTVLQPGQAGHGATGFSNAIERQAACTVADGLIAANAIFCPHPTLTGYRVAVADLEAAPSRSRSETYALYQGTGKDHRQVGRWGLTDDGTAYIEGPENEEEEL